MQFQTVFYVRSTGKIIDTFPNKYIRNKRDKEALCPGHRADEISFIYFAMSMPIDPANHRVRTGGPGVPAVIVEASGVPLVYAQKRQEFIDVSARHTDIIVDMADSMGDNLFRAAAVLEATKIYPRHKFYCKVAPEYKEVIRLVPDLKLWPDDAPPGVKENTAGIIKMQGGILADPRGLGYSKASLYGLWLNLQSVSETTTLRLPETWGTTLKAVLETAGIKKAQKYIVLQLRTKNWEGKSWSVADGAALAAMVKKVKKYETIVVGTAIDAPGNIDGLINLCGKTTWFETVCLLEGAEHVICIDSAILHLCRALGIKYHCLWGETHPTQILGDAPTEADIVESLAPRQNAIKNISPAVVFNRAFPGHRQTEALTFSRDMDTSQHGDQEIIYSIFERRPPEHFTLVDVGCYGIDMSNTYSLLRKGWRGIMIDAQPARAAACIEEFYGLDVKVLNIGVSDRSGSLPLYIHSEAGHDSFDEAWYPQDKTDKTLRIPTKPLADILRDEGVPPAFDLLSVDTEGWDERIVKALLEDMFFAPLIIVTEAASYKDAPALFREHGYSLVKRTGTTEYGNFIFIRDE